MNENEKSGSGDPSQEFWPESESPQPDVDCEINHLLRQRIQRLHTALKRMGAAWHAERADVLMYANHAQKVYYEVTDGRISNPNTLPEVVIAMHHDDMTIQIEEGIVHGTEDRDSRIIELTAALGELVRHVKKAEKSVEGLKLIASCEEILENE